MPPRQAIATPAKPSPSRARTPKTLAPKTLAPKTLAPKTPAFKAPATASRDPERTKAAILKAATAEITAKGLSGARIDRIAQRAGVNKRMIYHYFGDKEGLYVEVMETTYAAIRTAELGLNLTDRDPVGGMRELVHFTWRYFIDHPEFLSLLVTENLHRAVHLKKSRRIRALHSPLVDMISDLLTRGVAAGVFRGGVDPVHLYITIASIGFFYMNNRFTLSVIFGRDLGTQAALQEREDHITDVVLGYLAPGADPGSPLPRLPGA